MEEPPSGCQCFWRGLSRCHCTKSEKPADAADEPADEMEALLGTMPWVHEVQEPEPLRRARSEALEGRDTFRGKEPLVNLWREVSKPRKGGAIAAKPAGCKADFDFLFTQWLQDRGLDGMLTRGEDQEGWAVFRYDNPSPVVESQPEWEQAFHGTWWYAVWLILKSGVFLESNNRMLGHDFWEPGVYCSPSLDTGLWYARPQILFGDGVYYRVIFELRVDPSKRKRDRKRGGVQWVFPSAAVALHAVWVRSNAPPKNGEERVNGWDPALEALPPGCSALEPIVNPRELETDPWPEMEDDFPFDKGNNDAPPWMQSAKTSVGIRPAGRQALRPATAVAALANGGAIRPVAPRAKGGRGAIMPAMAALAAPGQLVKAPRPATFWGTGGRPPAPGGASFNGSQAAGGWWMNGASQEGWGDDSWAASMMMQDGWSEAWASSPAVAGRVQPGGSRGGGRWGGSIKPLAAKRPLEDGAEDDESGQAEKKACLAAAWSTKAFAGANGSRPRRWGAA